MSNYTPTTLFGPKDSLPPTNPAKTIFGAAYDVEFANIATAIASKLDASGGVVTSIAGTANQIVASASVGAVTLSLPSNVTIAGTLTANSFTGVGATISGNVAAATGTFSGTLTALTVTALPAAGANGLVSIGATGFGAGIALFDGNTGNREWQLRNGIDGVGVFAIGNIGSGNVPFSVSTGNNFTIGQTASGVALNVTGIDQTTSSVVTASGTVVLGSNGFSVNSGGALVFGAGTNNGGFVSIKGLLANGAGNTQGHMSFGTRRVATDATLTEAMQLNSNGQLTIQAPSAGIALSVFGTGGDAIAAQAGADLSGIIILGSQNNVSLTLNNTQAGSTGNWRIASSATGSGFGAGNFVIGHASTAVITIGGSGNVNILAPSSGTTAAIFGAANSAALFVAASNTASQAFGINMNAGTNASDYCINLNNAAGTGQYFQIRGDGSATIGIPTGGGLGIGTLNVASGIAIAGNPIYAGAPVNNQAGSYTAVLADANKQIVKTGAGAATITIPANSSVAFPIGTLITIHCSVGTAALSVTVTTDTLIWAQTGSLTSTRALAAAGLCTLTKINATSWVIAGTGVS